MFIIATEQIRLIMTTMQSIVYNEYFTSKSVMNIFKYNVNMDHIEFIKKFAWKYENVKHGVI